MDEISSGGRFIPPVISIRASGFWAASNLIAVSILFNSDERKDLISRSKTARAGTVFVVVPECKVVGTTVVPCSGFSSFASSETIQEISTVALIPFSGSSPAWDARPWILI